MLLSFAKREPESIVNQNRFHSEALHSEAPCFRAGAASTSIDPPLGLPMVGVVRRDQRAGVRLGSLEATAAAFERDGTRVILCGVDTAMILSPEVDRLRERVAEATGADMAGVVLNWNHTHHAPPGGRAVHNLKTDDPDADDAVFAYVDLLHDRIVEVCSAACQRLEPAWIRWGLGFVDESVNRRQRDPDGMVRRIGWNPEGLVDQSVPALQAVGRDGRSPVVTVVGYGCHTVTTGLGIVGYSPDFVGPLRDTIRAAIGGECVFLQGAGGNVMPRFAFDDSAQEYVRLGRRLAFEAIHALADRPGWPAQLTTAGFASATPLVLFRWEPIDGEPPGLAASEEQVDFPLLPLPTEEEVAVALERSEAGLREAVAGGVPESELRVLRYHGLYYYRRLQTEFASGPPRTSVSGPVCAIRIGNGAIATGPGEIFTEIGLAVKERSPAEVTLYAGYSNGAVSYFPTAAEYPLGGYEPSYGNKSYGLPTQVAPESERLLVETAVRLLRSLFPEREAPHVEGWLATGALPSPPPTPALIRPPLAIEDEVIPAVELHRA